jgi:hypothetical protein
MWKKTSSEETEKRRTEGRRGRGRGPKLEWKRKRGLGGRRGQKQSTVF